MTHPTTILKTKAGDDGEVAVTTAGNDGAIGGSNDDEDMVSLKVRNADASASETLYQWMCSFSNTTTSTEEKPDGDNDSSSLQLRTRRANALRCLLEQSSPVSSSPEGRHLLHYYPELHAQTTQDSYIYLPPVAAALGGRSTIPASTTGSGIRLPPLIDFNRTFKRGYGIMIWIRAGVEVSSSNGSSATISSTTHHPQQQQQQQILFRIATKNNRSTFLQCTLSKWDIEETGGGMTGRCHVILTIGGGTGSSSSTGSAASQSLLHDSRGGPSSSSKQHHHQPLPVHVATGSLSLKLGEWKLLSISHSNPYLKQPRLIMTLSGDTVLDAECPFPLIQEPHEDIPFFGTVSSSSTMSDFTSGATASLKRRISNNNHNESSTTTSTMDDVVLFQNLHIPLICGGCCILKEPFPNDPVVILGELGPCTSTVLSHPPPVPLNRDAATVSVHPLWQHSLGITNNGIHNNHSSSGGTTSRFHSTRKQLKQMQRMKSRDGGGGGGSTTMPSSSTMMMVPTTNTNQIQMEYSRIGIPSCKEGIKGADMVQVLRSKLLFEFHPNDASESARQQPPNSSTSSSSGTIKQPLQQPKHRFIPSTNVCGKLGTTENVRLGLVEPNKGGGGGGGGGGGSNSNMMTQQQQSNTNTTTANVNNSIELLGMGYVVSHMDLIPFNVWPKVVVGTVPPKLLPWQITSFSSLSSCSLVKAHVAIHSLSLCLLPFRMALSSLGEPYFSSKEQRHMQSTQTQMLYDLYQHNAAFSEELLCLIASLLRSSGELREEAVQSGYMYVLTGLLQNIVRRAHDVLPLSSSSVSSSISSGKKNNDNNHTAKSGSSHEEKKEESFDDNPSSSSCSNVICYQVPLGIVNGMLSVISACCGGVPFAAGGSTSQSKKNKPITTLSVASSSSKLLLDAASKNTSLPASLVLRRTSDLALQCLFGCCLQFGLWGGSGNSVSELLLQQQTTAATTNNNWKASSMILEAVTSRYCCSRVVSSSPQSSSSMMMSSRGSTSTSVVSGGNPYMFGMFLRNHLSVQTLLDMIQYHFVLSEESDRCDNDDDNDDDTNTTTCYYMKRCAYHVTSLLVVLLETSLNDNSQDGLIRFDHDCEACCTILSNAKMGSFVFDVVLRGLHVLLSKYTSTTASPLSSSPPYWYDNNDSLCQDEDDKDVDVNDQSQKEELTIDDELDKGTSNTTTKVIATSTNTPMVAMGGMGSPRNSSQQQQQKHLRYMSHRISQRLRLCELTSVIGPMLLLAPTTKNNTGMTSSTTSAPDDNISANKTEEHASSNVKSDDDGVLQLQKKKKNDSETILLNSCFDWKFHWRCSLLLWVWLVKEEGGGSSSGTSNESKKQQQQQQQNHHESSIVHQTCSLLLLRGKNGTVTQKYDIGSCVTLSLIQRLYGSSTMENNMELLMVVLPLVSPFVSSVLRSMLLCSEEKEAASYRRRLDELFNTVRCSIQNVMDESLMMQQQPQVQRGTTMGRSPMNKKGSGSCTSNLLHSPPLVLSTNYYSSSTTGTGSGRHISAPAGHSMKKTMEFMELSCYVLTQVLNMLLHSNDDDDDEDNNDTTTKEWYGRVEQDLVQMIVCTIMECTTTSTNLHHHRQSPSSTSRLTNSDENLVRVVGIWKSVLRALDDDCDAVVAEEATSSPSPRVEEASSSSASSQRKKDDDSTVGDGTIASNTKTQQKRWLLCRLTSFVLDRLCNDCIKEEEGGVGDFSSKNNSSKADSIEVWSKEMCASITCIVTLVEERKLLEPAATVMQTDDSDKNNNDSILCFSQRLLLRSLLRSMQCGRKQMGWDRGATRATTAGAVTATTTPEVSSRKNLASSTENAKSDGSPQKEQQQHFLLSPPSSFKAGHQTKYHPPLLCSLLNRSVRALPYLKNSTSRQRDGQVLSELRLPLSSQENSNGLCSVVSLWKLIRNEFQITYASSIREGLNFPFARDLGLSGLSNLRATVRAFQEEKDKILLSSKHSQKETPGSSQVILESLCLGEQVCNDVIVCIIETLHERHLLEREIRRRAGATRSNSGVDDASSTTFFDEQQPLQHQRSGLTTTKSADNDDFAGRAFVEQLILGSSPFPTAWSSTSSNAAAAKGTTVADDIDRKTIDDRGMKMLSNTSSTNNDGKDGVTPVTENETTVPNQTTNNTTNDEFEYDFINYTEALGSFESSADVSRVPEILSRSGTSQLPWTNYAGLFSALDQCHSFLYQAAKPTTIETTKTVANDDSNNNNNNNNTNEPLDNKESNDVADHLLETVAAYLDVWDKHTAAAASVVEGNIDDHTTGPPCYSPRGKVGGSSTASGGVLTISMTPSLSHSSSWSLSPRNAFIQQQQQSGVTTSETNHHKNIKASSSSTGSYMTRRFHELSFMEQRRLLDVKRLLLNPLEDALDVAMEDYCKLMHHHMHNGYSDQDDESEFESFNDRRRHFLEPNGERSIGDGGKDVYSRYVSYPINRMFRPYVPDYLDHSKTSSMAAAQQQRLQEQQQQQKEVDSNQNKVCNDATKEAQQKLQGTEKHDEERKEKSSHVVPAAVTSPAGLDGSSTLNQSLLDISSKVQIVDITKTALEAPPSEEDFDEHHEYDDDDGGLDIGFVDRSAFRQQEEHHDDHDDKTSTNTKQTTMKKASTSKGITTATKSSSQETAKSTSKKGQHDSLVIQPFDHTSTSSSCDETSTATSLTASAASVQSSSTQAVEITKSKDAEAASHEAKTSSHQKDEHDAVDRHTAQQQEQPSRLSDSSSMAVMSTPTTTINSMTSFSMPPAMTIGTGLPVEYQWENALHVRTEGSRKCSLLVTGSQMLLEYEGDLYDGEEEPSSTSGEDQYENNYGYDSRNQKGSSDDSSEAAAAAARRHHQHRQMKMRPKILRWAIAECTQIFLRRFRLRDSAMELFFVPSGGSGGSSPSASVFIDFGPGRMGNARRDLAAGAIMKRAPHQCIKQWPERFSHFVHEHRHRLTAAWVDGRLSNFDYLLHLNNLAGRTFNDLCQYPVMPWVLSNYTSTDIPDLTDKSNFRDLSKPMGALNPSRLEDFIERFETFQDPSIPPFMYGSHYSTSAGVVLHYLVRAHPFAGLHRQLQNGHFDVADRLFSSVRRTWEVCTGSSVAEVKELTPEWYCYPTFFRNINNFELGTSQEGDTLGDVVLPPWAQNSPEQFIEVMRAALESDVCSEMLPDWIDLIFGYKQQGPEAVKANNVFFYLTYYGSVDVASIEDESLRTATELQIAHFGQCPMQLFWRPHPRKRMYHYNQGRGLKNHHKEGFAEALKLHERIGRDTSEKNNALDSHDNNDNEQQPPSNDILISSSVNEQELFKSQSFSSHNLPFRGAPLSYWVNLAAPPPGPHAPLIAVRLAGIDRCITVDGQGIFHTFRWTWKADEPDDHHHHDHHHVGPKTSGTSAATAAALADRNGGRMDRGCFVAQRELPHFRMIPRLPNNKKSKQKQHAVVALSKTLFASRTLLLALSDGDDKGALAMQFVDPVKGLVKGEAVVPGVHSSMITTISMDPLGVATGGGAGGELAVVGSADGSASLWRFISSHYLPLRPKQLMRGHEGRPIHASVVNSAMNICATISSKRCCIFSLGNGSMLKSIRPPKDPILRQENDSDKTDATSKVESSTTTVFAETPAACFSVLGFIVLVCVTKKKTSSTNTGSSSTSSGNKDDDISMITLQLFSVEGIRCASKVLSPEEGIPLRLLPTFDGRAILVARKGGISVLHVSLSRQLECIDEWNVQGSSTLSSSPRKAISNANHTITVHDIDLGPSLFRPILAAASCSDGSLRLHALPGISSWSEANNRRLKGGGGSGTAAMAATTAAVVEKVLRSKPAEKFKKASGIMKGLGASMVGFGKELAREASSTSNDDVVQGSAASTVTREPSQRNTTGGGGFFGSVFQGNKGYQGGGQK